MKTITVDASKKYDVIIEKGILSRAGRIIKDTAGDALLTVVCDSTVNELYADSLTKQLPDGTLKFVFPAGETSKNLSTFSSLLEFMAQGGMTRRDCVVALGGGVTGDLAGYAAASYMRGISFIQIPTTLLAMTDSSVGGKTGVDLEAGKNLCGAFWQPEAVICDPSVLGTLPEDIYKDGMAEVVKYGIIRDRALFEAVGTEGGSDGVIARCVEIKRDIVGEDEREKGVRALLNFGHTPAHAIEKLSGYSIRHGEAVAAGMIIMTRAAYRMGLCDKQTVLATRELIYKCCKPRGLDYTPEELAREALADKKRRGDEITLVFPREIGRAELLKIPVTELCEVFRAGTEQD